MRIISVIRWETFGWSCTNDSAVFDTPSAPNRMVFFVFIFDFMVLGWVMVRWWVSSFVKDRRMLFLVVLMFQPVPQFNTLDTDVHCGDKRNLHVRKCSHRFQKQFLRLLEHVQQYQNLDRQFFQFLLYFLFMSSYCK